MTRRLPLLLVAVLAIAALDTACERTEYVTLPGKPDTVIVQRPGRTDTIVVVRPDTVVRPETSFIQLPGRVDTVVRVDTAVVTRPETLIVVQHDTVVKHDTIVHWDTVRLAREPAFICISLPRNDTLYAISPTDTLCDAAHLAKYYPGTSVFVNVDHLVLTLPAPSTSAYRGTLMLPGYLGSHGGAYR